jgi:hypothetical protein
VTLPFFRRGLRSRVPADDCISRLKKVLDRANVDYAQDYPELILRILPPSAPPQKVSRLEVQPFRSPLPSSARIAVLEGGFLSERDVREFALSDLAGLIAYEPQILVLPLNAALSLADQKQRGLRQVPEPSMAMGVITSIGDTPLQEHHRLLLWRAFGVPIFEQLRGWDGAIIARECEVHDGLHIDERAAIFHDYEDELLVTQLTSFAEPIVRAQTGLSGEILARRCECGSETPRLLNLSPVRTNVAAVVGKRV